MIPLGWKVLLLLTHCGLFMPLSGQAKKEGVMVLTGVTDPTCRGEATLQSELPLHKRGNKEYVWNTGDTSVCLVVLLCPVIRSMENSNNTIHPELQMAQTLEE